MRAGDRAGVRLAIRFALSFVLFCIFVLHGSGYAPMRLLTQIEAFTYDARVQLTLPEAPFPRVVIVDMDEKTLAAEGWPLPRDRLGRLVTLLFDTYGISALGSDIVFSEPDRSSGAEVLTRLAQKELADLPGFPERAAALAATMDHDRQFADALRGRAVVLGYFFKPTVVMREAPTSGAVCVPLLDKAGAADYEAVDFVTARGFGGNLVSLQAATPLCGFFDNPLVDPDGVFRRVPLLEQYDGALYPSLALALTRAALGNPPVSLEFSPPDQRTSLNIEGLHVGDLRVPVDGEVAALVPYRGRYGSFTYLSVTDVLHERVKAEKLKGAIVLLGTSAAGLMDLRSTPVGHNYAGVEVHANLVAGMLEGTVKRRAPYYSGIEFVMLLLIAVVVALSFPRLSPLAGAGMALGIGAGVTLLAFAMWSGANFVMPLGVPVLFTLAVFVAHLLYGYFIESRRTRDTHGVFGAYVPQSMVQEIAASRSAITMLGESRDMSALFSDVRGFADISERLDARELGELMNRLLSRQTAVVQQHRGTVDKYIGDTVMAFWGAPLADAAHAQHALEAALDMVTAVRGLHEAFAQRGWPALQIGIGVSSGRMSVGNMGSDFRAAYTVMGDAVNLGAQLERLTRDYGVDVLCTEYTRASASPEWSYREVDMIRVEGRTQTVGLFEPMGPKESLDPALRTELARHRGAMQLYREQKWDKAEAEFTALGKSERPHKLYQLFLQRIRVLRQHPPGADWNGVFSPPER